VLTRLIAICVLVPTVFLLCALPDQWLWAFGPYILKQYGGRIVGRCFKLAKYAKLLLQFHHIA